ncbi:hypothetical protein K457DRAFT_16990 [Linnemannia elongata AG-77]|uniref:Arm-like repeat domain-containing protein n=1 Tax=Linnemannia elongata AG-77 TaxID=1314771 RepID=A0A197K5F8_9FUNG|nr:hypothetical protein K457DRAFT_16990 [Linnemannia elongata AG-77]
MTDYATSNGYPDRVERTSKRKLTFDRLHICAKKAIDPCTDADRTLSNAIAAIHLENSKITSPDFVRLSKQAHHRNGSVLGPPLAAVPAAKTTTPCTGQKTPIQSTCRSFSSSSQSNNPQTIGSSSDDAGHTDCLLSHKSVNHSPMAQQPSCRDSLLTPSQASSFQTTVSSSDTTGLINFLLLPKSVAPSSPVVQQQQPPIHKIFLNNVAKPVLRSSLPELAFIFKSTRQLAFGLSLLTQEPTSSSSLIATQGKMQELVLTKDERAWVAKMRMSTEELDRLRWLAAQVATQFLKWQHKAAGSIEEVMLLGAVLERKEYRGVLSALIGQLEREKLMDVDLLQALVQFLQSAPPKHLVDDDFVRILRVLRGRLKNTHKALNDKKQPRSDHVYHLSTAIARVLDAMIAGKIHGLDRTEDYLPLSNLLTELKESLDPYLKFQATYAWQALQYVGDDETPLHAVLRFGGGVTKAALGVAGVFKLDPENLFNGLRELRQAAGQAYEVVKAGMEGAQAFRAGGEGVVDSMLKGFRSGAKQSWYPALQGARGLIGEGRLADFERVIYEAPCCREPEFQMGVCQLLGEVAVDPIWELGTRLQAVDLLRQLYESDTAWVANTCVKDGILGILLCLSMTEDDAIQLQTAVILEDLAYDRVGAPPGPYPLVPRLPIPTASPLLEKALKIQSIEHNLLRMKTLRLAHYDQAIYIPPLAKANPQTPEEEATPLMDQVKEFLDSDKQVFLVIGDSGSGKSIFNLHLEHTLWKAYEQGDPHIPLYIHLSTSRYLSSLIDEQLTKHDFDDLAIQGLKLASRKFIVICDGYDEARLTTNLHSSNGWNRPFGWNTKMIVSCRSTHLGREYHARFQPTPNSPYCDPLPHLFQEAVIVPFSQDQVKEYVEQFVRDPTVHGLFCRKEVQWSAEKYLDMIKRIPNLAELVKNPFLLTLALRALPDVVIDDGEGGTTFTTTDENATAGVAEMTRSQLYKSFVHQWLEINKRRLTTSLTLQCPTTAYTLTTSTATAASTLQELIDEGFQEVALDFLQSLAAAIYKYQRGKPIVEYWHRFDKTTWKADFFGPELNITLLRESSPLTKVENLHFFLHRSLLEYFYSCHLSRTTRPRYGFKESAIAEAVSMEQSWGTNNHQVNGAKPIVRVPQMTVPDTPTVSSPPPSAENVPETKASAVDTDANKAGTGPQPVLPLPSFKELALTTPPKDISIPPALPMESIKSALPETVQIKKNSRAEKWLTNAVKDKHVRMIPFSDISKVKYNVAKGGSGTIHFGCWRGMHIAIKEQHSTHDLIKELTANVQ